jgi:hypothetical protein
MYPKAATCCICDAPISGLELHEGPVCRLQQCRWAYRIIPGQHTCRVCRRPLAVPDRAAGVCSSPQCRHADHASRSRQARERMESADRALRQKRARRARIPDPESYPIARLPSFRRETGILPKRRLRSFRQHLEKLVAECEVAGWAIAPIASSAPPESHPVSSSAKETVSGIGCAACRGQCCSGGGDHAWLTTQTINRYRQLHPTARVADIVAAYLSRIGNRTYRGSCIYHGRHGCGLPRDMRSDTCNRYFCPELRTFRSALPAAGPVRAFFVWPGVGGRLDGAFVDTGKVRQPQRPGPNDWHEG